MFSVFRSTIISEGENYVQSFGAGAENPRIGIGLAKNQ
jgi:hypothetical protein